MGMVSEVNLKTLRSFQDHLGPFEAIFGLFLVIFWPRIKIEADQSCDHLKRPQEEQNSHGDGFGGEFEDAQVISGSFGTI